MTAVALLHPDVSPKVVEGFRGSGVEIAIPNGFEDGVSYSAALIFGGDGTVHRYLPELYRRRIPALVVPAGSGNDFGKAMGISSVHAAMAAWKRFCADRQNVREIDLGVIRSCGESGERKAEADESKSQEILFCCVAGIGMDAEANARANRLPAWLKGRGGYVLAALQSLIAFEPVEMQITADQSEIRGAAFLTAVGNAHRYGGGMKITPRATPDDGILDVCFVRRMNKLKLLCWVPTIFFGGHLGLRGVEYVHARALKIEAGRRLAVYADGDFACMTPVEITVMARAMKVIVPGLTSHQR